MRGFDSESGGVFPLLLSGDDSFVPRVFHIKIDAIADDCVSGDPPLLIFSFKGLHSVVVLLHFLTSEGLSDDAIEDLLDEERLFELLESESFPAKRTGVFVVERLFDAGQAEGVAALRNRRKYHDFETDGAVKFLGRRDCSKLILAKMDNFGCFWVFAFISL